MEEHILSPRVVLQELGHIINLKPTRQASKIISLTNSNQISVTPSEPRERYKKDLPLADLSADDDPAVLPGGVEGDLGRGEQLLGLARHGRPPTGALAVPFLLLCPCPYGGMGEGERYRAGEGKSWNKPR